MRFVFSLLTLVLLPLSLFTNEYGFYSPRVYGSRWPDFCAKHIYEDPEGCSERCIVDRDIALTYFNTGSSSCYIDNTCLDALPDGIDLIPQYRSSCDHCFCPNCNSTVILNYGICDYDWDDETEEMTNETYALIYQCQCINKWVFNDGMAFSEPLTKSDRESVDSWQHCRSRSIPWQYFNIHSRQYLEHLTSQLSYFKTNNNCLCYWPYRSKISCSISDHVYKKMRCLIENSYLSKLKDKQSNQDSFPFLGPRSAHGVVSDLFVHAFFYTQYRKILLDIATWAENHGPSPKNVTNSLDSIYSIIHTIQPQFLSLYNECLNTHPHPKILYERGMIYFHQGHPFNALRDISKLIRLCEKNEYKELLASDLYFQEGQFYAELGLYDKAIKSLTYAIRKDPNNKEAFF